MVLQFEQPDAFTIRCQFVFPGLQFGLNEAVIILNFTVPVTDYSVSIGYHKTQFQHNACMSGHSISGYETTSGHSILQRNITNNLVINKRESERANERESERENASTHEHELQIHTRTNKWKTLYNCYNAIITKCSHLLNRGVLTLICCAGTAGSANTSEGRRPDLGYHTIHHRR